MFLLIDTGGTNMRIAVSKDGKNLDDIKIIVTPQDFQEGIVAVKDAVFDLLGGETNINAIVYGVPGPLNKEKTKIANAPNLPYWNNKPLKEELEKIFCAPVYLENDAALAGLGEAVFGAGRGYSIIAYLTISTGVGGVKIINDKIDENAFGFEPGDQIISPGETLEELISGNALEKQFGKKAKDIEDAKIWDDVHRYLAVGINNIAVTWSPEVIVFGGAVGINRISEKKVADYLKQILKTFPVHPVIKKAELGDKSGLYGGLVYLRDLKTK